MEDNIPVAGGGLSNVVDDTTPQLGGALDANDFQVKWSKGADVASANALPILADGNYFDVTGVTTITSINTMGIGTLVCLHFDGILQITHNATDLILPTTADLTTAAGDEAIFVEYDTGDWRCTNYSKADGTPLAGGGGMSNLVEDVTPQLGGDLDMNGHNIGGNTEVQIDDAVATKHTQGTDTALGAQAENLNMNTHKMVGVVDPTTDQEAATKKYVDDNEGIAAVVDDTSPELGGQLVVHEFDVKLDSLLSADGKYSGITCDGVLGATLAFGDLVYLNTTDQRWELADADAEATAGDVMLALVLEAGNDGDTKLLLLQGFIREDDWNFTSYGQAMFVGLTAGDITQDVSSYTTGDIVRVIGHASTFADQIYFNPDGTWLEVT